jgi:GNAT superfamily N-acetyltransferase
VTDAVHVRPARSGDEQSLLELVLAAFAEYEGRLAPPSGAHRETVATISERLEHGALVAEADTEAVGCLFYRDRGNDLYVGRLAVLPTWRGRRIGRELLAAAYELARARGLAKVTVGVRLQLPENIGFFASMGFRPFDVGTHDGFRHPTFLWMQRLLP